MALSLNGRLLCAATHAYSVKSTGPVPGTLPPPNPPRSTLVGYGLPQEGFASGDDLMEAGLIGLAADAIIVAFRGTLPPSSPDIGQTILDWGSDADAPLVRGAGLPGMVHQGFLTALDALWPLMKPVLVNAIAGAPGKPIYVTGHSKGGAVANLAAMRIRAQLPDVGVLVRTFAAARTGDAAFAAAYAAAIPDSLRFEYADDIVPHLPPREVLAAELRTVPIVGATLGNLAVGYASVGRLQFIASGAAPGVTPRDDSPALEQARIDSLVARLRAFDFKSVKNDHAIDPGSGYADCVCPGF